MTFADATQIDRSLETETIPAAVLAGITKAHLNYERWTGGYWLSDSGVENVMQTYVAEHCFDAVQAFGMTVQMEAGAGVYLSKGSGRRFDVAVLDHAGRISHVIELKRGGGKAGEDADRFVEVLRTFEDDRAQRVRAAYWGAFVHDERGALALDRRVTRVRRAFETRVVGHGLRVEWRPARPNWPATGRTWGDGKDWVATALVATVTRA
jgi:hypothetical protein